MINLCFLDGIVKNEINLKFIYNSKTKSLSKKHVGIVLLDLEIEKEQIIQIYAYDEMADWIYQNLKKSDSIQIQGSIFGNNIEIEHIIKTKG